MGRAHGSDRRVKAAHHKLVKGLKPRQPLFPQQLDPVVNNGVIGLGRAKAERHQGRLFFEGGGNVEQVEQQAFGV